MSMHKIPLTDLEKQGLIEHGLSMDSPSQLSDSFRLGVQFATKEFNKTTVQLSKEKCALQAKVDALMLEFCPEEMTKEQIECWQESQIKYDVQQSVRYSQELSGSKLTDSQWKQISEWAKYFDN